MSESGLAVDPESYIPFRSICLGCYGFDLEHLKYGIGHDLGRGEIGRKGFLEGTSRARIVGHGFDVSSAMELWCWLWRCVLVVSSGGMVVVLGC